MYDITFRNNFSVAVQLEIRSGVSQDCDNNPSRFNGAVQAQSDQPFSTDDNVVCYRRTADPDNPGGGLGDWKTFSPDDINTPITIDL